MMRRFLILLLLLPLAACEKPTPGVRAPTTDGVVRTTFYPTTYFAQRIAGDRVPVECPVPDDVDPIFWSPSDDAIGAYQRAALVIVNGAGFERWVERVAMPRTRVVDTAAGFADEHIHMDAVTHSHGPAGDHSHEGLDGHTWLDPILAIRQAETIRDALIRRFPEDADAFGDGFDGLERDLRALDGELADVTDSLVGVRLLASHPAYNYVARRHGWTITNLDLDPEAALDTETTDAIRSALASDDPAIMLWESAPRPETAAALEQGLGIRSVVFSPAELVESARRAAGEDYLSIMRGNIVRLRDAATP